MQAQFETVLSEEEERAFEQWKAQHAPDDSGEDYDLRGAFREGLTPDSSGHWSDRYKKPSHPTFSVESIYAKDAPDKAGRRDGETFIPPSARQSTSAAPAAERLGPVHEAEAKLNALFDGLDRIESGLSPEAAAVFRDSMQRTLNPEEARAQAANKAFVLFHSPRSRESVETRWPLVRADVAKQLGIEKREVTDIELYGAIRARIAETGEKRKRATEIGRQMVEAAFAGETDWLTAYEKAAADRSGFTPAERDQLRDAARASFDRAAAKAAEVGPTVERILVSLAREQETVPGMENLRGFTKEEQVDMLAALPKEDRELVYGLIASRVKTHPDTKDAQTKGATQKVFERLYRDVRDMVKGHARVFEMTALAHWSEWAKWTPEQVEANGGFWRDDRGMFLPKSQIPGANVNTPPEVLAKFGITPATPEQVTLFREETAAKMTRFEVVQELRQLADTIIDPTAFEGRFANAIASSPGQLAYSMQAAVPVVGLALLVQTTQDLRMREAMGRGVPIAQAAEIAAGSALLEAPVEWVQSKMIFGKVPSAGGLLSKPLANQTLAEFGKRAGAVFAAETVLQNVQEAAQDATPLLLQEIASKWDPAVPAVTREDWQEFAGSRIDTAYSLLPLVLLGTGVATFQDRAFGQRYLSQLNVLEAVGFSPEQAARVAEAPTLDEKQALIREEWDSRRVGTADQQEAIEGIDAEMAAHAAPAASPVHAVRQEDGSFTVIDADGKVIDTAATAEAAAELVAAKTPNVEPVTLSEARATALRDAEGGHGGTDSLGMPDTPPAATDGTEGAPLGLGMPNPPRTEMKATGGAAVSAPRVIEVFGRILEVLGESGQIRKERSRVKNSLGEFWVREKVARVKTANDVSTAAHELSHAIEDAVFGVGSIWAENKSLSQAGKDELLKLGKDLYGPRMPTGSYRSEGFAEFMRLYLTDPEQAAAKAPAFSAFWESEMGKNPDLASAVKAAQAAGAQWFRQGSKARARAQIAPTPSRLQAAREWVSDTVRNLYRNFVEEAAAIENLTKEAEARLGRPLTPQEDPMLTLTARRLTADSIVEYFANRGVTDFAGNVVGKPLVDAFKLVEGKVEDFLIYLWAKRAMALWDEGKGRNPGLSREDANFLLNELQSSAFDRAAQIVYDWNEGVLNYAAQSSPDYARIVAKIRQVDPGFYIPLFREFEAFDGRRAAGGSGGGGGKGQNLLERLRGSGRRIKDPVESLLTHARRIVLKAQQKRVLDQIVKLADKVPGLGHYIVEVPKDQVPEAARSLQDILEAVDKHLRKLGGSVSVKGVRAMKKAGVDLDAEILTFFAPSYQPKQSEVPIMPIYTDGVVRWWEMDPDLYRALAGMDTYRLPAVLDLFLGVPARAFRLGTTGLRASFSLVTNPIRDLRTLHLNSRASAGSGRLFLEWLTSMRELALDSLSGGRLTSEWVQLAERLGIEMAQPLGQDTQPLHRAARRLKRGGRFNVLDPRDAIDLLRDLLQMTEKSSRIAEMRAVAKDMGWDPGQPLTPEIAAKLVVAGKQVTTDFTQAGSLARVVNQAIPFFNAAIQGPVAHLRAIKADPTKFLLRGLTLTALVLANWWRNKDEEWWQEMDQRERYGFTYIPYGDQLIRIPRAFEADGIFLAGAEALADAWYREDPKAAAKWFGTWLRNTSQMEVVDGMPVPPLPVLAQLSAEQLSNTNFYSGAPIVPRSQQDLPDALQSGPYTTRAAIALGQIFDASPRRIDHAIRSLFGGVGSDLTAVLGRGRSDIIEREFEPSDVPVFGVLFQRGGQQAAHPKSIEAMYDIYEEATQTRRANPEQTRKDRAAATMVGDAVRAVSIMEDVKHLTKSTAKRAAIESEQIAIAREVVGQWESGEINSRAMMRAEAHAEQMQRDKVRELGIKQRSQSRPLRPVIEGRSGK